MGFENCEVKNGRPQLLVKTTDGRHFELLASLDYVARDGRRFRVPMGATSDGCSTPPELWALMGKQWLAPFGTYWPAAVIHDAAYRNSLRLVTNDGVGSPANLAKDECDALFLEIMEYLGTSVGERSAIYEGVHLLGWGAFREDREAA